MSTELEQLLREAGASLPQPDPSLTERARRRAVSVGVGEPPGSPKPPPPVRFADRRLRRVVGGALLLATAAGFGVGYLLGPRGGDAAPPASGGPSFKSLRGWNVESVAIAGPDSALTAIASNVPRGGKTLAQTLRSLPPNGVVVVATLYPKSAGFSLQLVSQRLPLRLADMRILRGRHGRLERSLVADFGGRAYGIHVYFGARRPAKQVLQEADLELGQLQTGVATDQVTVDVQPATGVVGDQLRLSGEVVSRAMGDEVVVEMKDCGSSWFRTVGSAGTNAAGRWQMDVAPTTGTVVRAVWNGDQSAEVVLAVRPRVVLERVGPSRYVAAVVAPQSFAGRLGVVERFDVAARRWLRVRSVVFSTNVAPPSEIVGYPSARFSASTVRHANLRVVLPQSETRPCYARGVSNEVRG